MKKDHSKHHRLFPPTRVLALLSAIVLGIIASGCKTQPAPQTAAPSPPHQFISKKTGKSFTYVIVADMDAEHERFEIPHGLFRPSKDNFAGTDRKAAKTSVSDAPPTTRADVAELLANLPASDDQMLNHNPPISKSADSDRVIEEQQNVVVLNGFIYAVAKESDNDYHVILGTAPGGPGQYVNVEISGLPASGPFRAPLRDVRTKFQDFFGSTIAGSGYHKFTGNPIPVRITGSLFYDIDHPPGAVGPADTKPQTAWEIHPVTDIEFEP
jgi:hypothetical protein